MALPISYAAHLLCCPSHSLSTDPMPGPPQKWGTLRGKQAFFLKPGGSRISTGRQHRSIIWRLVLLEWTKVDSIDGRNPANQLKLVVYPIIPWFTKFYTSQVVQDFFYQRHLPKGTSRLVHESYRDVCFLFNQLHAHHTSRSREDLLPAWNPAENLDFF